MIGRDAAEHERRPHPLNRRQMLAEEHLSPDHRKHRLAEQQDRRLDGRQPRERRGNQQPSRHLGDERERDQPAMRRPRRREGEMRIERRDEQRAEDGADRRVEERPGVGPRNRLATRKVMRKPA